jgi:hypothetical protein
MTIHCPDRLELVDARPSAREGRRQRCRPHRPPSENRMDTPSQFQQFVHQHSQRTQ